MSYVYIYLFALCSVPFIIDGADFPVLYSSSLISLTATPLIQTFTSHPGYDGHTRYPDGNYTQDWYITTNWINHTIKINFATCFIENSRGVCLFDYLYVYDGAKSSSPEMMKTCCGKTHSATLESSAGEMYILFVTDNTVGDTGFEIEYWSNGITTTTTTTTVVPSTEPTTDSVRWNMTSFPERHDVSCLSDSISVFIPSDLLSHYYSTWRDPHCQVQDNGTHYVSTISHTSCGTTVIFTKDEVIFENELILHKSGSSSNQALTNSSIDFDSPNSELIPVQCIYPRRQNITTLYRPAQSRVRFYEKRYGHMDVQLEQYKTGKFVTPLPVRSFPNEVEINKDMYFILHAMHVNSTDVAVKVDSCVATPSIMPADGRIYQLLDHGCPASPAVKVYPSSFDEVRFSVRAFEFRTSPGGTVYIHCQVSVCSPTSPQCVTGCSHRHRRDVSREDGGSHLVSGGPYLLVADKGGLQVSTVVAGVCASVAVVATVMAIIGWKRKSSASTSGSTF